MSKGRKTTWLALIVLAPCLLLVALLGFWGYMSMTATSLHPDPRGVPSVTRSEPPRQWLDAVERGRQIIRAGLAGQNVPGMSVAVGAGGEIVWAEGFGFADLENQVRVTPDTPFRIGTISTMLTSAGAGLLLEKDRLKLDDEIQKYVTAFPKKQWPVTLRQVMGHLGGVVPDEGDEEPVRLHCERTLDGLQRFAERPLLFEPGTRYRYSSYGWRLVSAAIETAADEPFFTFMRNRIFEPLGMTDTGADSGMEAAPDLAVYYFPRFAADPRYGHQGPEDVDYSCFSGSGAFLSTPSDLVRFGMAIDGGKLLKPATVQMLEAPQRTASGEDTGYGLGFDVETVALAGGERRLVVHDGEMRGGMVASYISFPERGIVVAVTSNMSHADTASLALSVAQAFADRIGGPARK